MQVPTKDCVSLTVYSFTFLLGLPSNLLVLFIVPQTCPIDILQLNLTIFDLIFLPFKMKEAADDINWNLLFFLCPVTGFLFYSTIYNSTLLQTAELDGTVMDNPPTTCYLNITQDQLSILLPVRLELFLVLFCTPFLVCPFCYVNFIRILSQLPNIERWSTINACLDPIIFYFSAAVRSMLSHSFRSFTAAPHW
ncbi:unnamed protein product [Coregonus sp. 'balchen']|nr:unnamed protein product [Coregonus sp. 'balchen']